MTTGRAKEKSSVRCPFGNLFEKAYLLLHQTSGATADQPLLKGNNRRINHIILYSKRLSGQSEPLAPFLDVGTRTHRLDRELGRPEEYCRKSRLLSGGNRQTTSGTSASAAKAIHMMHLKDVSLWCKKKIEHHLLIKEWPNTS